MRLIDRTNERYERLVVTGRAPNASQKDTNARWHCKCDCGRMVIAYGQDLAKGKIKSCGCLNAERIYKHGKSRTKVHQVWRMMFQRCENPKNEAYKNYGARGITVDPRWKDFQVFHDDMGEPPPGYTLERKDNNGPYSKDNCVWASYKDQLNNRRTNRLLTFQGKTQTIGQWADEIGVSWHLIRNRIDVYGWSVERALSKNPHHKGS